MLIRQGITPEKIAMSIALGVVLGTVPILGITTVLCAAAAVAFRLNVAAVQLANWLACPLQIVLLIPFFVMGGISSAPLPAHRMLRSWWSFSGRISSPRWVVQRK